MHHKEYPDGKMEYPLQKTRVNIESNKHQETEKIKETLALEEQQEVPLIRRKIKKGTENKFREREKRFVFIVSDMCSMLKHDQQLLLPFSFIIMMIVILIIIFSSILGA